MRGRETENAAQRTVCIVPRVFLHLLTISSGCVLIYPGLRTSFSVFHLLAMSLFYCIVMNLRNGHSASVLRTITRSAFRQCDIALTWYCTHIFQTQCALFRTQVYSHLSNAVYLCVFAMLKFTNIVVCFISNTIRLLCCVLKQTVCLDLLGKRALLLSCFSSKWECSMMITRRR